MLHQMLAKIMDEYPVARNQTFANHALAQYIRQEVPHLLKGNFPHFSGLEWAGSAGQGQWADAPWIAAFDLLVTETPQDGYYPVYLFTRTLDAVYLSLNQGMTRLRIEFGASQAKEIMAKRALILRARLQQEFPSRFTSDAIDLQPLGQSTRLAFYEPGHVFGVQHFHTALPEDAKLLADLEEMLRLYQTAIERGGIEEFDSRRTIEDERHSYEAEISLEEKRRLRLHFTIERNQRLSQLAKKHHGLRCQVCDFSYSDKYGDLGRGYIEAHHLTPLAELPPNQPVKLSAVADFAVVCANYHRMIHRKGAPGPFEDFQKMYRAINGDIPSA